MGLRQREHALKRRVELRRLLGDKCAKCGNISNLEFDCIIPQGDEHNRMDQPRRTSFYWRQHKAENLQLLCAQPCHADKTKADRERADRDPF